MSCGENCQCSSEQIHTQDAISEAGELRALLEEADVGLRSMLELRDKLLKQRNDLIVELYETKQDREKLFFQFTEAATDLHQTRSDLQHVLAENAEMKESLAVNGLGGKEDFDMAMEEYVPCGGCGCDEQGDS